MKSTEKAAKGFLLLIFFLTLLQASFETRSKTIRCYTGTYLSEPTTQGGFILTPCSLGACSTLKANISISVGGSTVPGSWIVGQCTTRDKCNLITCEQVRENVPPSLSVTLTTCSAFCCSGDKCNVRVVNDGHINARPSPVPYPGVMSFSVRERPGGMITCFTGAKMSGFSSQGGLVPTPCSAGTCSTLTADISVVSLRSTETVSMTVGFCLSRLACSSLTCQVADGLIPSSVRGKVINCVTSCCHEDRCNSPAGEVNVGITTPSVLPSITHAAFPSASTTTIRNRPISCYTGTQMSGPMSQGPLVLSPCPAGTCATLNANISVAIAGQSVSVDMVMGQCVTAQECTLFTCKQVKSVLPPSLPVTLSSCMTSCCSENRCNGQGNAVASPSPVPVCQIPMWNLQSKDNWIDAGRKIKTKPKFQLIVKRVGKTGRFSPNKKHKIMVRIHKKSRKAKQPVLMSGFYITLEGLNSTCNCRKKSSDCQVGKFIGSRLRRAGEPVVHPSCDQPLTMEYPPNGTTSAPVTALWIAPKCSGPIIMRVAVKGSDGVLYSDTNEDAPPKKRLLTKLLTPR